MLGDWFVYCLITFNAGAMISYAWAGHWWKAVYWFAVIILNVSLLKLK